MFFSYAIIDESTSMRDKLERFKKEREMRKALVKKEVKPAFKAGVVQRHKSTWSPPPPPPTKYTFIYIIF